MKNDKYILDKYLQDKVAEANFDMQESHWLKALEALENDEGVTKKVFPWLRALLMAGLLLIGAAVYYIINHQKSNTPKQIVSNTINKVDSNIAPTIANTALMNDADNDRPTNNSTKIVDKVIKASPIASIQKEKAKPAPKRVIDNNAAVNNENTKVQIEKVLAENTEKQVANKVVKTDNIGTAIKNKIAKIFTKAKLSKEEIAIENQNAEIVLQENKKAANLAKKLADAEKKIATSLAKQTLAKQKKDKEALEKEIRLAELQVAKDLKKIELQKIKLQKEEKWKAKAAAKIVANIKKELAKENALQEKTQKLALAKEKNRIKELATAKEKLIASQKTNAIILVEKKSNSKENIVVIEKVAVPVAKSNPRFVDAKDLKYKPKKKVEEEDNSDWTIVTSRRTIAVPKKEVVDTATKTAATTTIVKNKFNPAKTKASATINVQLGMTNAIKNATNTSTWKPAPYLGFGYWFALTNRLDVHAQIGASYINGLQYQYTATNYTYGFGVDSTSFTLQQKTLYQLCIPMSLSYKLSLRQSILGGVGANIGLDVLSSVKQFNATTNKNRWSFQNGYQTFAPFVTLGYQYQLHSHLFLQAIYQQGLNDITNNAFFGNTNVDRNNKATFGITYKLK